MPKRTPQILFLALVCVLVCSSAYAQTFKSYRSGSAGGPATSVSTSATMNVATGDLVVLFVGHSGTSLEVAPTVSDGGSNTATCPDTPSTAQATGTPGSLWMCYVQNATANATATWTSTWGTNRSFIEIMASNYSGMATSSVLDKGPVCNVSGCNSASTGGSRSAVNTSTTGQANELLVAGTYEDNTSNWTAAQSYNLRTGTSALDHQFADVNVTSTGAYPGGNFATVNTTTVNYLSVFATFKAASGNNQVGNISETLSPSQSITVVPATCGIVVVRAPS
jgi:hypothetical protein